MQANFRSQIGKYLKRIQNKNWLEVIFFFIFNVQKLNHSLQKWCFLYETESESYVLFLSLQARLKLALKRKENKEFKQVLFQTSLEK